MFDEDAGNLIQTPPPPTRHVALPDPQVLAYLNAQFPRRMAKANDIRARTKVQTGAGYRRNILVRIIVSTMTDLGLGTQSYDARSREFQFEGKWVTIGTKDIIISLGMAQSTFTSARSQVETCYRLRQWMVDNPRLWNGEDDDGKDRRLFDALQAFCRKGVLPPMTSPLAEGLSRSERRALLAGGRELYLESLEWIRENADVVTDTLQRSSILYEPEE